MAEASKAAMAAGDAARAGGATERPPVAVGPIVAAPGASAATASRPDQPLDDQRYHIYESNPAPWWIALLWLAFFVFGVTYLVVNLIE